MLDPNSQQVLLKINKNICKNHPHWLRSLAIGSSRILCGEWEIFLDEDLSADKFSMHKTAIQNLFEIAQLLYFTIFKTIKCLLLNSYRFYGFSV